MGGNLGKKQDTCLVQIKILLFELSCPQVQQQICGIDSLSDPGQFKKMIQSVFVKGRFPVQIKSELLVEADPSFSLDKRSDIKGAHFLRTGTVSQIKPLVTSMGPIGSFRHMDDNYFMLGKFFNLNGNRRITGSCHAFNLGKNFIGKRNACNPIFIIHTDKNSSTGSIGKGHQLL